MAFTHGKNSHFSIDDDGGGSLTDISAYVDTTDGLPGEREMADVTAYGDGGHRYIPGLENATFTVGGSWDPTLDGVMSTLRAAEATASFEFGPAGSANGAVKLSGECWVTNYTVSAPVADKVTWTANVSVDGTVSVGTFSA